MESNNLSELEFAERLKKLEADFEFFAHVTSHDLRDPLRQARIETNGLLEKLNPDEKLAIESINRHIDEVLEKISILRDYSYLANNKEPHAAVDLNKILENVTSKLAEKINKNAALIKISPLPTVQGNAKLLERLFGYLIDNALQFSNPSTQPEIFISALEEENFWHFTICDNGIGLDKLYRELVFVLFQKLDTETKTGGYGAGLAFSRKIINNHGGKIWYESDGASGTNFHFTIKK